MGFLGVRFEVGGGVKLAPCLKLVRITLEYGNLARKYTPYVVSENIPLLMSAFLKRNQRFLAKIVPLLKAIV